MPAFYAPIGQPHFRRNDHGTFTELEPSFHDMVAYRATAERALTRFAKGDSFVAEGYTRAFPIERDGQVLERAKRPSPRRSATISPAPTTRSIATDAPAWTGGTCRRWARLRAPCPHA